MYRKPFITKLHLQNFRSIRDEVIEFDNPLFLVGKNGSGKSNILDALAFLSECMTKPVASALSGRVREQHSDHEPGELPLRLPLFGIRADFEQDSELGNIHGHYAFAVDTNDSGVFVVENEQCVVTDQTGNHKWFNRTDNAYTTNIAGLNPVINEHALAFPIIAGVADFAPVLMAFSSIRVYDIEPKRIAGTSELDGNTVLNRDGSNVTNVLYYLQQINNGTPTRLAQLLKSVVPGITRIEPYKWPFGNKAVSLRFHQQSPDSEDYKFSASDMSDGTLQALALTVAALQDPAPSVIAIEEPESGLHPSALEAISDLIEAAAKRSQIIITTHSPDLLDAKWIQPENLRIVTWEHGTTHVSSLGEVPVKFLREHLMGAGELLRANSLDEQSPAEEVASKGLFDRLAA